jgi:hypothetical protein
VDWGSSWDFLWHSLIVFPWLTAVIYLIARGQGMALRAQQTAAAVKTETDAYIREAAGRCPAQEIADAKAVHA